MGLIFLCFWNGEDVDFLGLIGFERYIIDMFDLKDVKFGMDIIVRVDDREFICVLCFDI